MNSWALPADYLLSYGALTWRQLRWGVSNGWADPTTAIAFARRRLTGESDGQALLALAGLREDQAAEVPYFLTALAEGEPPTSDSKVKEKWIYLVFRWVLEHRDQFSNPLAVAEELYADFDYPEAVESFIRYMPATSGYDPSAHSVQENEARLFRNWQEFVKEVELRAIRDRPS